MPSRTFSTFAMYSSGAWSAVMGASFTRFGRGTWSAVRAMACVEMPPREKIVLEALDLLFFCDP